jgi:hypothetical protein
MRGPSCILFGDDHGEAKVTIWQTGPELLCFTDLARKSAPSLEFKT